MKRMLCLILVMSLFCSGCGFLGKKIQEPVRFYYLQKEYQFDGIQSVIGFEEREASGHRDSLSYLLALYLMGPGDEDLRSPVPRGVRIYVESQTGSTVALKLSDYAASMTDADYSLACACLAMTCMELTGAESVTVTSSTRTITIGKDNLLLLDTSATTPTEETQ